MEERVLFAAMQGRTDPAAEAFLDRVAEALTQGRDDAEHARFLAAWVRRRAARLVIEPFDRPAWAHTLGRDGTGLFAAADLKGVTQRVRWIGPGRFLMGSPTDEHERRDNERQHEVCLTRGFWLAETACTQALWQAVMGENPSHFKGERRPVENVSWNDVQRFLERLNGAVPDLDARLPTEAEWEYACRAGTTTPFAFGDDIDPAQANYDGNYPYRSDKKGRYRSETVEVASLPANPWGRSASRSGPHAPRDPNTDRNL